MVYRDRNVEEVITRMTTASRYLAGQRQSSGDITLELEQTGCGLGDVEKLSLAVQAALTLQAKSGTSIA